MYTVERTILKRHHGSCIVVYGVQNFRIFNYALVSLHMRDTLQIADQRITEFHAV